MFHLADVTTEYRAKLIKDAYKKWIRKGDTILDIGCGNGVIGKSVSDYFECSLTGCDVDNYLIRDIPFTLMKNESKLPFRKHFQIAMFNDALHHIEEETRKKLVKNALEISDSVLIFEFIPALQGKFVDYAINKIHNPHMKIIYDYKTRNEWHTFFKNLGVKTKVEEIRVPKPFWYPFAHIAFKLSK